MSTPPANPVIAPPPVTATTTVCRLIGPVCGVSSLEDGSGVGEDGSVGDGVDVCDDAGLIVGDGAGVAVGVGVGAIGAGVALGTGVVATVGLGVAGLGVAGFGVAGFGVAGLGVGAGVALAVMVKY